MRRSTPADINNRVSNLLSKVYAAKNKDELDLYMYELMDMFPYDSTWIKNMGNIEKDALRIINERHPKENTHEEL